MIAEATKRALLLVEDNPADADLVMELLAGAGGEQYRILLATRVAQALQKLRENRVDVVLLDLRLPDGSGVDTVKSVLAAADQAPIIVLTGTDDEELALSCIDAGAEDYLYKGEIQPGLLRRAIGYSISRRREAQVRQDHIQQLVSASPDAVVVTDMDRNILFVNEAAAKLFSSDRLAMIGVPFEYELWDGLVAEIQIPRHGARRTAEMRVVQIEWHGEPAFLASTRDNTAQKMLEDRMRQSQKLEAIGRLAGGVAHDFNNLLTVILNSAYMLKEQAPTEMPDKELINDIAEAGERAAALTRELLAFSRQSIIKPVTLNLNSLVREIERLLARLIGEDIELVTDLDPSLGSTLADPSQIGQVIMNLAVNARDAMPKGGRLVIRTRNVRLGDAETEANPDAEPGDYISLSLSDTGVGIDENARAHLFEPFFTTKDRGKGTGLGLATVYGVVSQSGGHVTVDSTPGGGTTFHVYLPALDLEEEPKQIDTPTPHATAGGNETILVVEDEPSVRDTALRILRALGYNTLEAENGLQAIEVLRERRGAVQLVLTDAVMPKMGGLELLDLVRRIYPRIGLLVMSGYSEEIAAQRGQDFGDTHFLQKPFTRASLARAVREVLDSAVRD